MPGRIAVRSGRPAGPRPFSSEWLAADAPEESPPKAFRLPPWVPGGRTISTAIVVVVSVAAASAALLGGDRMMFVSPAPTQTLTVPAAPLAPSDVGSAQPTALVPAPTAATVLAPDAGTTGSDTPPKFAQAPDVAADLAAPLARVPATGALLPAYRIVTFYGHPHDPAMGIVGEREIDQLTDMLREEAANYAAADPSRPVIPALELIATVAQRVPGSDGTYILDTDTETLTTYIDYAAEQGMIVVLDLQVGRSTVAAEIEKVRDLLARPNVHLAIDPEFAVAEGQIPGEYIGSVSAESITYAQKVLAEIATEHGLPPKLLIVHQFREDMIQGKEKLAPVPGVQLVIDADGYGGPELKTAVYNFLVRDEPVEFAGVKLFYGQDMPLMTPQEILALVPAPDVIIYQ
ncbi:MAG: hypothetical protein K0Q89_339 [Thermomicrobiales bacterium]|nr:hypothetical protein [Thermomicrobiales bacterium]